MPAGSAGQIVVNGLSKDFGRIRAVDSLSFTVEPGSVTGFLGPNGAGKTTTLRMVLGLVRPSTGLATVGGQRYVDLRHPLQTVGALLEAASFHPARSARNHLRVYAAAAGVPGSRADEVLGMVGLADSARRKVKGYSLGMRQRLGLAAALLGDPGVLVLDEPANGLDPEGIAWLRGFLRHLAGQGRTVLVSSHVLSEVQQVADRVVILAKGRLIRQGTIKELAAGHGETVVVASPDVDRLAGALAEHRVSFTRSGPKELRVSGMPAPEVGHHAFLASAELHELRTEEFDLEQIFFQLTSGAPGAVAPMGGGMPAGYAPPIPQPPQPPMQPPGHPGPAPTYGPGPGGAR